MVQGISGVILTGGNNRRFNGIEKSNVIIDGEPIISRIINVLSNIFEEIILVTNNPHNFDGYPNIKITCDYFLKVGPLGGIHSACRSSSNNSIFVFAGDMPSLNKDIIIRQLEYFNNLSCDVLVPQINNFIEPLHAIYNTSIVKILEEYITESDDYSVRNFFNMLNISYMRLNDTEETRHAFLNINSPNDISKFEVSQDFN